MEFHGFCCPFWSYGPLLIPSFFRFRLLFFRLISSSLSFSSPQFLVCFYEIDKYVKYLWPYAVPIFLFVLLFTCIHSPIYFILFAFLIILFSTFQSVVALLTYVLSYDIFVPFFWTILWRFCSKMLPPVSSAKAKQSTFRLSSKITFIRKCLEINLISKELNYNSSDVLYKKHK